jgi:hypothetical protein
MICNKHEQHGPWRWLLKELEIAYGKISNNPEHFGFIDERKELRDFLIHRFPISCCLPYQK